MTGAAPAQPALACGGNQVGILGKGHYCIGRAGEPPRAPSQTASPFPHGIAVALAPCEPRGVRFSFACADKQLSPGDRQTEERKNHVRPDVTPRLHGRRSNRSRRARRSRARGLLQHLREFREIERKGEGREAGHPRHELRHELQRLAPHHHRRQRRRHLPSPDADHGPRRPRRRPLSGRQCRARCAPRPRSSIPSSPTGRRGCTIPSAPFSTTETSRCGCFGTGKTMSRRRPWR